MTPTTQTLASGDEVWGHADDSSFETTVQTPYRTETGEFDFVAIQQSAEFVQLRRLLRGFVFPMTGLFLLWYLTFVLLAAYDHSLMSIKIYGEINVGLVLGLLQFASTILITLGYARYARNRIDPGVSTLRDQAGVSAQ